MKKFLMTYFAIIWEVKFSVLIIWLFLFLLTICNKLPFSFLHLAISSFCFALGFVSFIILFIILLSNHRYK
jgi:hypothetical protein